MSNLQDLSVKVVSKEGSIQFNNFESLKATVNTTLTKYNGLVLTDDNKQEIKGFRAELNKVSKALNDERIKIKREYVKPLELFEDQVKEITVLIKTTVDKLATQVKEAEDAEKDEKRNVVKLYFDELLLANPTVNFIKFDDLNLNVTLSVSEKRLKEETKEFVDKVLLDLEEINTDPNKDRLHAKYLLIRDLQQARLQLNRELQQEALIIERADDVVSETPAVEVDVAPFVEEVFESITFTVKNVTKSKVLKIKALLESEGIDYE